MFRSENCFFFFNVDEGFVSEVSNEKTIEMNEKA